MNSPTTEAGRRLLVILADILAIETEVRADLAARIEARVLDCHVSESFGGIEVADVLAVIRYEAER